MQYKYCRNLERCFTGDAPSLSVLTATFGNEITETWLAVQIRDISEFCNCKEKITIKQIDCLAKTISTSFHYLKVTELMYFFLIFKGGRFGHFYGTIDSMVITDALYKFLPIRNNLLNKFITAQKMKRQEAENEEHKKRAMSYEEWKELEWLFKMGYEQWRVKKELAEQHKSVKR